MEARVAKIEATVEHIQSDVSDIKMDVRGLRDKVDQNFITLLGRMDGQLGRIDKHFLLNWAGIIAVTLGLAGLMAKGFGWF